MHTRVIDEAAVAKRSHQDPARTVGLPIGMTTRECERGSIAAFVRAFVNNDKESLAFFREVSEQVEKASARQRHGFHSYLVPGDVTVGRRDFSKAGTGANLVDLQSKGFVAALDAASLIGRLPITRLDNMVGDATITRETVKGTAGWLAGEADQAPDAQSTFGQISLTPKTISAVVTMSRQIVMQAGPAGNAFIERALAVTVAEAVDRALFAGSSVSGQPTGLLNVPGIDTRTGDTFTYTMAVAMDKVASGYDASGSKFWVAGVDAAEDLQLRERASGSGFIADAGQILGAPLIVSRSVGAQVLCVMPWSQLWFATWGNLEIGVDPYTDFNTGKVTIRCLWDVDFAVERAASVAVATAVT